MSDRTMDNIKTLNNTVRTGLMVLVFGFLGYAGWWTYTNYIGPSHQAKQALADLKELQAKYDEQSEELTLTKVENERLETSMRLLKVDRRLAKITVTEMDQDEEGKPFFDVVFEEVNEYDQPIGKRREFRLNGEFMYVDCLVCKFQDKYVEESDELRNASLCIFKKIYGDKDGLEGGHSLDLETEDGKFKAPGVYYTGKEMTGFEEKIWSGFWEIANDAELQEELGVKGAHGQVNYIKAEAGKVYRAEVRASGGWTLKPWGPAE